jgi:hypothetical protein
MWLNLRNNKVLKRYEENKVKVIEKRCTPYSPLDRFNENLLTSHKNDQTTEKIKK